MRRIAYMIGSVNRGGTETLLMDVFRRADIVPYEMILLHRKGGAMEAELHKCVKGLRLPVSGRRYITYLLKLRHLLLHEGVTFVHAQYWLDCIYAWLATIGVKIPIVLTFHGYFLKRGWRAIPIRMAIRMADKVCFVSESEKKMFEDYYGDILVGKSEIIYNGIDFEKFDDILTLQDTLPTEYRIGDQAIKMVMVGNFVRGRDQKFLCQVLKQLHDKDVKFEMYFVGRKSEQEPWRMEECQRICENMPEVHFLGGRSDVPAILKEMDLCVYSTHHDTFGIAIMEPIAVGLPTIVNDYVVAKEVTNNGEWATLYKTGDVEDCCRKIEDCISHLELYKTKSQRDKLAVREKYSIENHIKRLEEVYESIGSR